MNSPRIGTPPLSGFNPAAISLAANPRPLWLEPADVLAWREFLPPVGPLSLWRPPLVDVSISPPGEARRIAATADELIDELRKAIGRPADYDGPIFVCDIDDTLRSASWSDFLKKRQVPAHEGARELLQAVAAPNIPIMYLTAAWSKFRDYNREFLSQFPKGTLIDRNSSGIGEFFGGNDNQAEEQAEYKSFVLGKLRLAFPQAQLFGLGDDQYGDAYAYTRQQMHAYIRDVREGSDNIPADFLGSTTRSYDASFRARVQSDLAEAMTRSKSYGGTPVKVDPQQQLSAILDKVTGTPRSYGNTMQLHVDGAAARPPMLASIASARRNVFYETFNFLDDKVGNEVADHLIAAHRRGCQVLVVADAVGSAHLPGRKNAVLERMMAAGVEVAIYNPIDGDGDLRIDRDHRKVLVVDNTGEGSGGRAFVSGMNTGDGYLGDGPDTRHDLCSEMTGPAVAEVSRHFLDSYRAAGGEVVVAATGATAASPASNGVPLRIIAQSIDSEPVIRAAYLALVNRAREVLDIENNQPFAEELLDAVLAAAHRGVKVRYIVGASEALTAKAATASFQKLLDAGVEIYVYPQRLHTKAIAVDGIAFSVGSANIDKLSLRLNRDIIAIIEDKAEVAKANATLFERDLVGDGKGRKTIKLPKDLNHPRWLKLLHAILRGAWPTGPLAA